MPQNLPLETPAGLSQSSALPTGTFQPLPLPQGPAQMWVGLCFPGFNGIPPALLCCFRVHWGCCAISWQLIASQGVCHCDEIITAGPSSPSAGSFLTGARSEACWMCCRLQDSWNLPPEMRSAAGSGQWAKETLLSWTLV